MNYILNNPGMKIYVKSMGKVFRITAICKTYKEANEIYRKYDEMAVIAEDKQGLVFVANKYASVCKSDKIIDD